MSRVPPIRRRRRWERWLFSIASLTVTLALVGAAVRTNLSLGSRATDPLTCRVTRGPFQHDVFVQGEVESAVNVEVRCEVRSESSSWVRILDVIPEGTMVQPGDVLVRLDSSGLEADRDRQRIVCAQARAAVIQARTRYETAKLNKEAYLGDEFRLAEEKAKSALMVAEEAERRAKEFLECSRELAEQGYITELQLRADEYAWRAAKTDLHMAQIRLAVLENFTKPVRLTQLNAALVTAQARLAAAQCHENLALERLKQIEEQIEKCVVRAHVSGQVVLAHLFHNDHAHMVQPGELTIEKRVLVRLPDFRKMQVAALVEEDKIALVRPGMAATVRLQAFPNVAVRGRVTKIHEYPVAEDWLGSAIKRYKTIIAIDSPPPGTRPGMTAEARLHLHRLENPLQVPCPAVIRHGDKSYCIGIKDGEYELREVVLGPSNGANVVVREGLREGEQIALAAASHRDKIQLPDLKQPSPVVSSLSADLRGPAGARAQN